MRTPRKLAVGSVRDVAIAAATQCAAAEAGICVNPNASIRGGVATSVGKRKRTPLPVQLPKRGEKHDVDTLRRPVGSPPPSQAGLQEVRLVHHQQ
mmetsp:Transcript_102102/g.284438  ORF Transcript_102102/g.284438 Transcript_102102/m.284438 type:complete len:95 (-) Transcript_102102:400-684(-)